MSRVGATGTPPRRSLRVRLGALCAGLGVAPFALALTLLYPAARTEVEEMRGQALARDAARLSRQIRAQVVSGGLWVGRLAATPDVRRYLAGTGPYPEGAVAAARHLLPGVRRLEVLRPGERPGPADVPRGDELSYAVQVPARQDALGTIQVALDLDAVRALVEAAQKGEASHAVLLNAAGQRLAGPVNVPLPSAPSLAGLVANGSFSFEVEEEIFLAGYARVSPGVAGAAAPAGWAVVMVEPAAEALGPLHTETRRIALFFAGFAALAAVLSWRLAGRFLQPLQQLSHGAEIVSRIHLGHRLDVRTGDEFQALAEQFNRMAESLQGAYDELEGRVRETTLHLREERNRLAAVLRTMAEGVVMANEAGEVVLITPRARLALGAGASSGVGVPLAGLLPRDRLEFHLRRLRQAWDEGREIVEAVVFPLPEGRLIRGLLSAVPGPAGERSGFLFVFRDLSARAEEGEQRETVLRELPELLKGPAATLRSLAEVLENRPSMDEARRREFLAALQEEARRLSERLRVAEQAANLTESDRWPASPADPVALLREAAASLPAGAVSVEESAEPLPQVRVETFFWVSGLASVLRWLGGPVTARVALEEEAVVTTLRVEGAGPADPSELPELTVVSPGEEPVALGEAVRRNRGELWTRRSGQGFEVRLALVAAARSGRVEAPGIADAQPEFYDFDLFLPRLGAERGELLSAPLAELEYVVFDTETTGLNPSEGDEIVSLSGVRIRRGKVVAADTFHTLVNPGRPVPPESTSFHGLDDVAVQGAPTMAYVLPEFKNYVGEAVLVAHNAAFDKKFLDLAAARHRLSLVDNPILDTLFLSYGVHPEFEGHNLDAIAARLGVEIRGRHTSLGDSKVTAEIFLKLLPLLAARSVVTLADAKSFCDRMLLLRWQTSRF
ncbi:MAG: HAMP domain-containing protein [Deltaproteobacteria bacterium]|nr:HAMP domain-containing protein [Deltaproteobacteria bacterium]